MSRHANTDPQHVAASHRHGLHLVDDSIAPPGSPMEPGTPGSPDAPGMPESPGMPEAPQPSSPEPIPGGEPAPYAPDEGLEDEPMTGSGRAF